MNVVKMQDMLKDLSDRQLMQTMEAGSSPQYLVLAEMQRRKKAREGGAQSESQSDRSVADDIISGIAAVPTGPMEMAEGGIVSFAGGGKTGRMKGEEEACYVDSRTGEKYCPPSRPQVEMPRTGQRKSFQEGGMIPPQEMVEMDIARRLQELQSRNPNATEYDAIQALMREGTYGLRLSGSSGTDASDTTTSPAMPSPQPEPAPAPSSGLGELSGGSGPMGMGPGGPMGVGGSSTYAPGQPGEVTMPETESQREPENTRGRGTAAGSGYSLSEIGEGISGLFGGQVEGGTRRDRREDRASRFTGAAEEVAPEDTPPNDPRLTGGRSAAGQETAEERVESEAKRREEKAGTNGTEGEDAGGNVFAPPTDTSRGDDGDSDQPVERDGLMELYERLQGQQEEQQAAARQDAINQALIRGGLTMAGSRRQDILGAAAEGGLEGLTGYQQDMARAAEQQAVGSKQMTDLMVAREANDIRRQAAQAKAQGNLTDERFKQINALTDLLNSEVENVVTAEDPEAQQARINNLRQQIFALMGMDPSSMGGGQNVLSYGEEDLVEN